MIALMTIDNCCEKVAIETDDDGEDDTNIGCRSLAVIVPLIRGDPRQAEQGDRQGQVRCCGVDPHLVGGGNYFATLIMTIMMDDRTAPWGMR